MEDNASMEVVAIDSDDNTEAPLSLSDRPIIQLFKRLITNDSKQSTVLTNAQIVEILIKEFSIDLWNIHELEGEIYITIMKKYLKDWPQWDEFDRQINKLKSQNNKEAIDKMLETNYYNLKEYLKVMLDSSQALAKATVNKVKEEKAKMLKDKKDSPSDMVVLQVQSSRNQLNQLFFRRPIPDLNNTIFNSKFTIPTQIKIFTMPLDAMLNWWSIKISVYKGTVYFYERSTVHQLEHVLVNKNLMSARYSPLKTLPQEVQVNCVPKTEKRMLWHINHYISLIDKLLLKSEHQSHKDIYDFIRRDLKLLPTNVYRRASYRRYTNKYPYIRYLYKDVQNPDISCRKYDLQLEETVSPMYRIYLGQSMVQDLSVECVACSIEFTGPDIVEDMRTHFEERHQYEPDWKCTNCNERFPMVALAEHWWTHRC